MGAVALAGCPAEDLCVPEEDSERVVHVEPATAPGPDNPTVAGTFSTIQSALDAVGGDRGRATVCVAHGTYYEQLRVPADTHLVAAGEVRVRPPQTRKGALPTEVDRVLLTLQTDATVGPIVIDGLDVRSGGLCVDAVGDGAATLRDMMVQDCAVGLRARGGTQITLHDVAMNLHGVWGIDAVASTIHAESDTTIRQNGRPALPYEQTELPELDAEMGWVAGLSPGRGAVRAVDSDITLVDVLVDENEYSGAVLDVQGGSLTLRDIVVGAQRSADNTEGFFAGESGGDGPVVLARDTEVDIHGFVARSEGHTPFRVEGSAPFRAVNVDWNGRMPTTAPEGAPGPALEAAGDATITLWHATLLGPEGAPGFRFLGDSPATLDLANTIAWGHASGEGLVIEGAPPVADIRYSLFADASVQGTQMVTALDPLWTETSAGLVLDAASPARCAGAGDLDVATDLWGNPRPFAPDKSPDLGAIELQEACP